MVDSELYPCLTFRDPMIRPEYLKTSDPQSIFVQEKNDWLLNAYISKLDQEVVDDLKELAAQAPFCKKLIDTIRMFGWATVQSYTTGPKIFSSREKKDWITELDAATMQKKRIGVNVQWIDDLGNSFSDQLYFVPRENANKEIIGPAWLFWWDLGDGTPIPHAIDDTRSYMPDLTPSLISMAIQCRQIQDALSFAGTNPFFYHFKYGPDISPAQRTDLLTQIAYIKTSVGIGAKSTILEEIVPVENSAVEKTMTALDAMIGFFAANARLPLSYFLAERQTGGLGDTGETEDNSEVLLKKASIYNHLADQLAPFLQAEFGITLPKDNLFSKQLEEAKQKAEAQNGQETEGSDRPAEAE